MNRYATLFLAPSPYPLPPRCAWWRGDSYFLASSLVARNQGLPLTPQTWDGFNYRSLVASNQATLLPSSPRCAWWRGDSYFLASSLVARNQGLPLTPQTWGGFNYRILVASNQATLLPSSPRCAWWRGDSYFLASSLVARNQGLPLTPKPGAGLITEAWLQATRLLCYPLPRAARGGEEILIS
ncbi:MAG: hypothetical protein WC785_08815 [Tatlockia sp.]|jgi:hypothetical protein